MITALTLMRTCLIRTDCCACTTSHEPLGGYRSIKALSSFLYLRHLLCGGKISYAFLLAPSVQVALKHVSPNGVPPVCWVG